MSIQGLTPTPVSLEQYQTMTEAHDLEEFRLQLRSWLEANCPPSQRKPVVQSEQIWGGRRRQFSSDDARAWFEACRDRGFTAPDWPAEYGGAGLSDDEARVLKKEMKQLGCRPPLYDQGLWMLGPALLVYGTEEQKREHLTAITRGEIRWAQGYSEPNVSLLW